MIVQHVAKKSITCVVVFIEKIEKGIYNALGGNVNGL